MPNLIDILQKLAQRLVKAIDAAGLDDDTVIPGKYDWRGKKVSWIRKAANGEDVGYLYSNDLVWSEFDVVKAAQVLHCSADYICGLTEDLTPTQPEEGGPSIVPPPFVAEGSLVDFRWRTDKPGEKDEGWAVVKLRFFDMQPRKVVFWRDGAWRLTAKEDASKLDDKWTVEGWFPLPPDEDEEVQA